jgi:hypothetical protein
MSTGSATTRPRPATSTDQVKYGRRRMFMPGARVVRMVVTSEITVASRPTITRAAQRMNSSTKRRLPPPGPPLLMME